MRRVGRVAQAVCVAASLYLQGCGSSTSQPAAHTLPRAPDGERLFARGAAFAAHGDDVRAEQYFNAARRARHPDAIVLPELIALCVRASRLRAAIGYALEGLRQRPSDYRLGFLIASLHIALEQPADALRMLELVVHLQPAWPEAHYLRARLFRDSFADFAGASGAFRAYLERAPNGGHRQEALAFLSVHPAPKTRSPKGRR